MNECLNIGKYLIIGMGRLSPVELIRLLDPVDAHQPVLAGVRLLQVGQVKVLGFRHILGAFIASSK